MQKLDFIVGLYSITCRRLNLPQQKWTKKLGENKLNSSFQLLQDQQCGSSRQQCPASRDRVNLGFTQPSPLLQVPPWVVTVSNEHYTLLTHPLFTSKSICGGLEMKHLKRDVYINFFLNMLLSISARLKKKVLSKTRSAHICCEGTGVIPSISKERPTALWWISSRHFHSHLWLQQLKLLHSLSLGMFLGDPAAAWISIAVGGPSTGGQHFTHALHQAAELTPSFSVHSTHPCHKGKSKSLWAC